MISDDKVGGDRQGTKASAAKPSNRMFTDKTFEEYAEQFAELTATDIDSQAEFFLKSFIFDLGDEWNAVNAIAKQFKEYIASKGFSSNDLDAGQAADFLQKNGQTRTALQRRAELSDIDLDKNDRICLTEYLLLHFKALILQAYFNRKQMAPTVDLSNNGIGLTGVGAMLLEELFTVPDGCDPAVTKAIEEFMAAQRKRNKAMKELADKAAQGGVKGMAAQNELRQMEAEDQTLTNKIELTLNAAKKRTAKYGGKEALLDAKQQEEEAKQQQIQNSRAKLAARAAQFENK
ncbi:hypothetical protein PBRA_006560 [Plasmodiophora brassicae]|nr:hypothetical protein PBRA_006560 [Plasmodiophora brassicae]